MTTFLMVILFVVYGCFTTLRIDLTSADLGRHLKNGQLILDSLSVPNHNLYSFSFPDFGVINHHWGSGVIFYLVHLIGGFSALSIFFSLVRLTTLGICLWITRKASSLNRALYISVIALPLLIYRGEIRPEIFSDLLMVLVLGILLEIRDRRLTTKRLYILPVIELFWINLHIYFWLGYLLMVIFLAECLIKKYLLKQNIAEGFLPRLVSVLVVSILAGLINPAGVKGLTLPLSIFQNYGYRLLENQSIPFLERIISFPVGWYFKLAAVVLILSWGWRASIVRYDLKKYDLTLLALSVLMLLAGWLAVRNLTAFGWLFIPIVAINLADFGVVIKDRLQGQFIKIMTLASLCLLILVLRSDFWEAQNRFGVGLENGNQLSAKFFINYKIQGPIFNNYDIGGYLIYYLYPNEQVFVDNRPEAYPKDFFEKIYIPMQQDEGEWIKQDNKYHFNAIFFNRRDLTPWGQKFLVSRFNDPHWAPVFVDNWTIIFVKRNDQNKALIDKFGLPKERFKVS